MYISIARYDLMTVMYLCSNCSFYLYNLSLNIRLKSQNYILAQLIEFIMHFSDNLFIRYPLTFNIAAITNFDMHV
jgi:hypothetical protein